MTKILILAAFALIATVPAAQAMPQVGVQFVPYVPAPEITPADAPVGVGVQFVPNLGTPMVEELQAELLPASCAQVYPWSALCDLPFGPVKVVTWFLGF